MTDIHDHRRAAREKGHTFHLDYYTDLGPRRVEVFLLRHSDGGFTLRDAGNGRFLGFGDTKDDALLDAQIRLHQWEDFGIALPPVPEE